MKRQKYISPWCDAFADCCDSSSISNHLPFCDKIIRFIIQDFSEHFLLLDGPWPWTEDKNHSAALMNEIKVQVDDDSRTVSGKYHHQGAFYTMTKAVNLSCGCPCPWRRSISVMELQRDNVTIPSKWFRKIRSAALSFVRMYRKSTWSSLVIRRETKCDHGNKNLFYYQ